MTQEGLVDVLRKGMADIEQERVAFEAMYASALNAQGIASPEVSIDPSGIDPDLASAFNATASIPQKQLYLQWQTMRHAAQTRLLVQAIAAYLARVPSPATDEAIEAGKSTGEAVRKPARK